MMFSGTTSGPELLVELDRAAADPLHRQLANGLRDAIRAGRLSPHTRLPSTRVLAADLGVSRRLVVDAYNQLVAEGSCSVAWFGHPGRHRRRGERPRRMPSRTDVAMTSTSCPDPRISPAFPATHGCVHYGRG